MSGGAIAAISATINAMSLSASLSKSAAPAGGIVTSDASAVSVPIGNSGALSIANRSDTGTVTLEFQLNGGGWVPDAVSGNATNGQNLEARIRNSTAGESSTFSIIELDTSRPVGGPFTIAAV